MTIEIGVWDMVLCAAVSLQAALLSYLYHPRWKAFILTLPIPFTLASLAVGHPIDASNILALCLLLIFTHGVRLLHQQLRVPIVPAIIVAAAAFCGLALMIAPILPRTEMSFWLSVGATLLIAALILKFSPPREEPGHRTPLPLWLKLPMIFAIVFGLVLLKNYMQGFMTSFPMVGVLAAYESRHSLWTNSRQISVLILTAIPMLVTCHLTQPFWGLPISLVFGWLVFLIVLSPVMYKLWQAEKADKEALSIHSQSV